MMLVRGSLLIGVAIVLPACHGGGGGQGSAGSSAPPAAQPPEPPAVEVSFSRDVFPILQVRCQVCHTTGSGAAQVPDMLMTDPVTLYSAWVRILSQCNANLFRVYPERSDLSFVVDKIRHPSPLCGARMPLEGAPLTDAEQATIATWIDQGAVNN